MLPILTAGVRIRPEDNLEVAFGCAMQAGDENDVLLCRPYIEVATWSPNQAALFRRW